MIFNRRSKVVVDCFTTDPFVYEDAKIESGIHFYPEWWKSIPQTNQDWEKVYLKTYNPENLGGINTMKSCLGFMNLYRRSFVLPLWCEFRLHIGSEEAMNNGLPAYSFSFADRKSHAESHPTADHNNSFKEKDYQHLKIFSPWKLDCQSSVDWMLSPPSWHMMNKLEPVTILPGIVDFCYQASTNINMFIKRQKSEDLFLHFPFRLPMYHLIPLTEKKVSLRHHLVSEEELNLISARTGKMTRRYFGASFSKHKQMRSKL